MRVLVIKGIWVLDVVSFNKRFKGNCYQNFTIKFFMLATQQLESWNLSRKVRCLDGNYVPSV